MGVGRKNRRAESFNLAASPHSMPHPKVSTLKNYRLDQFSVERLMAFLTRLNEDVEIMIRPRPSASATGHISVLAAQ
jgi:hypothetical protein